MTASEDVRTWQTHEREIRSVGASANRLDLRRDAFHLHGLHRFLHDVVMRLYLLTHVIILVLHLKDCSALSILLVYEVHAFLHVGLLLLVKTHVMVADDV